MTLNYTNLESVIKSKIEGLTATVTAASSNGTTVTYTASNRFSTGQIVSITGLSTAAFNLANVTIASATTQQFTVTNAATGTAVTEAVGVAVVNVDTKELLLQMKALETATTNLSLGRVVSEGNYQYNQISTIASQTLTDIQNASSGILANAALTGIPTAPTAPAGTNTTQVATTAYVTDSVSTAVGAVIDSAPTALNTLNELSAALNDDANFASSIATSLSQKASLSGSEILTNKTISGSSNTLTDIPNSSLSNSLITINGTAVSLGGSLTIAGTIPSQSGNADKFLFTDGTTSSWQTQSYGIVASNGTTQIKRPTLNFIGATISDDLLNNRTNVNIDSGNITGFGLLRYMQDITGINFVGGII
jgi:hypothetical protein